MDMDQNQSIGCFEDLPNELFHIVFQYLDLGELYRSIFGLNGRFTKLLNSCSSHYLCVDGKTSPDVIKIFASKIRSISIKDHRNFISLAPVSNSLSVLTIQNLTREYLKELPLLVHLQYLTVKGIPSYPEGYELTEYIASATQLHRFDLPDSCLGGCSYVFSSLRSHRVHRLTRIEITDVFKYAPNLTYLHYSDPYIEELPAINGNSSITYPSITGFRLDLPNGFTRSQLDFYLAPMSQIKSFHISAFPCIAYNSQKGAYMLLNLIANLIEERLLNLKKFRCSVTFYIQSSEPFDITQIHPIYHQKNSIRILQNTQLFRSHWIRNY